MTDNLTDLLQRISGGQVLDIATGKGDFLKYLTDTLADFDQALGVDVSHPHLLAAQEKTSDDRISFVAMDALKLSLTDNSFDTISISNSLHHLPDVAPFLPELKRVARPSGHLVLCEPIRNIDNAKQETHLLLHHWWGAVDRNDGISHNETFSLEQLNDMIDSLGLNQVEVFVLTEWDDSPAEGEIIEQMLPICDQYIERLAKADGSAELIATGHELKNRLQTTGITWTPHLYAVGQW